MYPNICLLFVPSERGRRIPIESGSIATQGRRTVIDHSFDPTQSHQTWARIVWKNDIKDKEYYYISPHVVMDFEKRKYFYSLTALNLFLPGVS